jgi:cation diffusion facilitator CzcD-associated flavoprotein CzcO
VSESIDIASVGSGFSGLGMAIQLKRQGRQDFVVLERADEVDSYELVPARSPEREEVAA